MADTIIEGTLLNVNNLMYTKPKANEKGGKSLNILNKASKTGLRITTPLMVNWGAAEFVDKDGKGNGKYEMSLQFPSDEYTNEDCELFLKNMKELENKIKQDALVNSKEWFGKVHKSIDIIDELFTPMLKYPKVSKGSSESDFTKKPCLRVKIPQWEGAWKCEIYDEDEKALFPDKSDPSVTPLNYLKKGVQIACIIQCGGIWFTNGKFAITWKLVQAVVQKPKASIQGQCFIKLKSSDKDKMKNSPDPVDDDEGCAQVEDSDYEYDAKEDEVAVPEPVPEPEPEPEPAPPVVEEKPKKRTFKKKE